MKRHISLFLCLIFFLSAGKAVAFNDVFIDDPYYDAIDHYEQLGLIDGYANGSFQSQQKINRVELLKVMLKIKQVDLTTVQTTGLQFKDIIETLWYMPYLKYAYDMKYVQGYPDQTFRPGNNVTLAETLSILDKVYGITVSNETKPENWTVPYMEEAKQSGLLQIIGITDPQHEMRRGEVMALVYKRETQNDPKPLLELEKPYTLDTLDLIEGKKTEDGAWNEKLSLLKDHVQQDINNDYELPVKVHIQERALSCEVASLKTVLDYHGLVQTEKTLFSALVKIEPYEYDQESNVWGDPQIGFVGNVDGSQIKRTGYGVHWDPIRNLAREYGAQAESFEGEDLNFLLQNVIQGRPVEIWGYVQSGGLTDLSWKTPEGKEIYAVNNEHTFTVIGFEGNIQAPTGIILIDPIKGRIVQDQATFMKNWGVFNNSGVLIEGRI